MTMTSYRVREICKERLAGWTEQLVGEHATPVILIGVGHDHKSGQLTVVTTEDLPNDAVAAFLEGAWKKFRQMKGG
jgi:hypothetical protein